MLTLGFWIGSKALFSGRGFSWLVCGLVAMPFDLYLGMKVIGLT
jgi:hypothetical protein